MFQGPQGAGLDLQTCVEAKEAHRGAWRWRLGVQPCSSADLSPSQQGRIMASRGTVKSERTLISQSSKYEAAC